MSLLGLLLLLSAAFAAGALHMNACRVSARSGLAGLGIALPLGLGALAYAFWIGTLAGIRLSQPLVTCFCLALIAAGLYWMFRRPLDWAGKSWRDGLKPQCPLDHLVWVTLGVFCLCLVLTAWTTPLKSFDGRIIWSFHARLIFDTGIYPAPELKDPAFVIGHAQYPPLLAMGEALAAFAGGGFDERATRAIPLLFYFASVLVLLGSVSRGSPQWGLLLVSAYALMPTLTIFEEGGADAGTADTAVGALVLVSALLAQWEAGYKDPKASGPAGRLLLSGFSAALAGLFKNEGLVLGCLLAAHVVWMERRAPGKAFFFLAGWLLPLLPWLLVRGGLAVRFEENYVDYLTLGRLWWGLGRAEDVLGEMFQQMFLMPQRAGFFWWVVVAWFLITKGKKEILLGRGLWIVPAFISVIFALYLITPLEGTSQVVLSFSRILLQVAPLALFAVAGRDCSQKKAVV